MWKKGESGNPKGSPKRRLITSHLERSLLEAADGGDVTRARKIAEQVVKMAEEGDRWAIQFVTERTEGKPDQHVSISNSVRELTDADLTNIATGSGDRASGEAQSAPVSGSVH